MKVFSYCSQLTHFEGKYASTDGKLLIKDNTLIGFADPDAIEVVIPSQEIDVERVGHMVFAGHENLRRVTCTCEYESDTFEYCSAIEELTVSERFVHGFEFLEYCPALTHLTVLGEGTDYGLNEISFPTAWFPENIESITLPKNTGIIGPVGLPVGCQIYGPNASADHTCWIVHSNWFDADELQLFSFPQDVSSYLLPSTVTYIGTLFNTYDKRYGSYMLLDYRIYVPSSVTRIWLGSIGIPFYLQGSIPPTLDEEWPSAPVYVKSEYYSTYQSAWSTYISDYGLDLRTY